MIFNVRKVSNDISPFIIVLWTSHYSMFYIFFLISIFSFPVSCHSFDLLSLKSVCGLSSCLVNKDWHY